MDISPEPATPDVDDEGESPVQAGGGDDTCRVRIESAERALQSPDRAAHNKYSKTAVYG